MARNKILIGKIILGYLVAMFLVYSQVITQESNLFEATATNQTIKAKNINSMPDSTHVSIKVSQLIAREELRSPLGVSSQTNRDIGFASVFLSLENHQETNQSIIIQNVEILNISDRQLQSFTFEPKKIELKPLENSVIDIHTTNKTGYIGQDRVKAIVTYQIGDHINVIESKSVEIDRH